MGKDRRDRRHRGRDSGDRGHLACEIEQLRGALMGNDWSIYGFVRTFLFGFIVLWTLPSPATALTASQLLTSCETLERTWSIQPNGSIRFQFNDGLSCWGDVQAFFDLSYVQLKSTDRPNDPFTNPLETCPPNGVSLTQLVRMFLQYAREHTADLHYEASMMMMTVLRQKFPCP